jgi:hypothetical protein
MDRRDFLKLSAAGVSAITMTRLGVAPATAQDGTPAAGGLYTAGELGLEELLIRQIDGGYEAPAEIAAGRYLLTVENASSAEVGGAGFIAAPEGQTTADVQAQFEAINEFFMALEMGTPPAGEDPTAFLFEAVAIGGPATGGPGSIGQAIVDLPAGEYVIWGEDFSLPTGVITVTGELPADLAEPEAAATVTAVAVEDHFDFQVDGQPVAGKQLIKFFNDSDQPHFLVLLTSPTPLNDDQWLELLMLFESGGTPAADSGLPPLEEVLDFGATVSQSQGQTIWWAVDLPPGNYGIMCFIPDPRHQGMPHSASGMIGSFSVA